MKTKYFIIAVVISTISISLSGEDAYLNGKKVDIADYFLAEVVYSGQSDNFGSFKLLVYVGTNGKTYSATKMETNNFVALKDFDVSIISLYYFLNNKKDLLNEKNQVDAKYVADLIMIHTAIPTKLVRESKTNNIEVFVYQMNFYDTEIIANLEITFDQNKVKTLSFDFPKPFSEQRIQM